MHSYGLKIRNTGGQAGTFVGELEVSRKQLDEWRESATLNIGPLEPGETGTEERPFAYSEPMTVQFRLTDFDAQTTYEVVRPTMESP
ncbi:hypothetical protein C475_14228 [Halosimplex carlsbadense 2-9-1]|uniref:Uncharacterized protein n=2 Tax=Halosimplex carlsbadense TaxID=171164 RepID=M0CKG3_9EURY|nr:hypothetical protein C475_14228 [Halosimplex carlsbadense 2-9-1]